jgi:hypothetical protein
MKSSKHFGQVLFHNGVSFIFLVYLAQSYLEPGATSFLLKVIISALTGIVIVFRYIWLAFRAFFSRSAPAKQFDKQEEEAEDT